MVSLGVEKSTAKAHDAQLSTITRNPHRIDKAYHVIFQRAGIVGSDQNLCWVIVLLALFQRRNKQTDAIE